MECKDNTVRTWFRTIGSINRNIVECKVHRNCDLLCTLFRINRNIVECKAGTVLGKNFHWNSLGKAIGDGISINRNIVECKAIIPQAWNSLMSVLIETLWNVKMFAHGITSPDVPY